ncbi:hypothetical protein Agabi119p4_6124 [Agaricus bisporus var. burnettii]|uniref:Uncharacterized protein n=1 Tax=Agaricus bisporus var. burnettii TaxID=192524 RepID=A0A8H7F165_AGABI|nr:hypothetical protein Agabi119p4_6124 [Agaricus bisporus var. burnettii]
MAQARKIPLDLPGTRILNGANWANNSATENLATNSGTLIIFDQSTPGQDADRWLIHNYLDGYKIFNMGSSNWASVSRGNTVLGVPEFDGQTCKWSIEYSGNGEEFWIRVPREGGGGAVWTIRPASDQGPTTVFLDLLKETDPNQRIKFAV